VEEEHGSSTLRLTKWRVARMREEKVDLASRGFARREKKSWVLQLTKSRSAKWQGEKFEPLDPGMRGLLDQNSVEISYIGSSGVRRLEGVTFDHKIREVPRAEARENTWRIHKVGPA
jgi:hypothetical protein